MAAITKAIIPAAGRGKRFYPWTLQNPKELMPVFIPKGFSEHYNRLSANGNGVTCAVIDLVVMEAYEAGLKNIQIITAAGKSGISEHLTKQQQSGYIPRDAKLSFANQLEPLGPGDAVL